MNLPIAVDPNELRDTALVRNLAHLSLVPFVGMMLLLWLVSAELQVWVSIALAAYGALVASFLGGIHWGIGWYASMKERQANQNPRALQAQKHHVLWGIVPPLMAWPGILMPAFAGLAWLGFLLMICYLADRVLYPRAGLQQWLNLRFRLTAVAALSCFIGAGAL